MMISRQNGHKHTTYSERFPEDITDWRVTIKCVDDHERYPIEVEWVTAHLLKAKKGALYSAADVETLNLYW